MNHIQLNIILYEVLSRQDDDQRPSEGEEPVSLPFPKVCVQISDPGLHHQ